MIGEKSEFSAFNIVESAVLHNTRLGFPSQKRCTSIRCLAAVSRRMLKVVG